jgi:hypothetical protein
MPVLVVVPVETRFPACVAPVVLGCELMVFTASARCAGAWGCLGREGGLRRYAGRDLTTANFSFIAKNGFSKYW